MSVIFKWISEKYKTTYFSLILLKISPECGRRVYFKTEEEFKCY